MNDYLIFQDEKKNQETGSGLPEDSWKILIIDDEEEVHRATRLALSDFRFEGRGISLISGYSAREARELIREHSDTAVMLLDVVMEADDSGLEATRYIRDKLGNKLVRIILRTGQAGQFPEEKVFEEYDINDFLEKADTTSHRLKTALKTGIRGFEHMKKIAEFAEIIEDDLRSARIIQDRLLTNPGKVQDVFEKIGYRAAVFNQPPETISGDFFFPKIISQTSAGLFFADTCGHGTQAALISMRLLSIIDHLRSPSHHASEFLDMVNTDIHGLMPSGRFIVGTYLILNGQGFYISNSGQPNPILVKKGKAVFLKTEGMPLGLKADAQFYDIEGKLSSGDRLIFYTDGIIEGVNTEEEQYGSERLFKSVQSRADISIEELQAGILADATQFFGDRSFDDDITFIIFEKM